MIHYLLVDFGCRDNNGKLIPSGGMYTLGISGEKEDIVNFLYQNSTYVIFLKTKENPSRNEKGDRILPCGIVVSCKWQGDRFDTFSNWRMRGVDERYVGDKSDI